MTSLNRAKITWKKNPGFRMLLAMCSNSYTRGPYLGRRKAGRFVSVFLYVMGLCALILA